MKKPFRHTELSNVECIHDKCAMVHGRQGVVKQKIKKNVIARAVEGSRPTCHACRRYIRTGMTLRQQKIARGKIVEDNTKTMHASM